jgi:aminoglycoside phosphotransferase (APT) family kinase protein
LEGVLDFEAAAVGDPAFDLRYLPSLGGTTELFEEVRSVYQREWISRAWAWHFLTDLGDALWRTEQGAPLEGGPLTRRVDDLLDRLVK